MTRADQPPGSHERRSPLGHLGLSLPLMPALHTPGRKIQILFQSSILPEQSINTNAISFSLTVIFNECKQS